MGHSSLPPNAMVFVTSQVSSHSPRSNMWPTKFQVFLLVSSLVYSKAELTIAAASGPDSFYGLRGYGGVARDEPQLAQRVGKDGLILGARARYQWSRAMSPHGQRGWTWVSSTSQHHKSRLTEIMEATKKCTLYPEHSLYKRFRLLSMPTNCLARGMGT